MRSLDVPALERALRAPVSLVRSTGNLTRGALENARRSTAQIAAAVGERRHLAELLASPQPGTLELLDARECWALLRSRVVGRFVYVAREGTPDVVLVNYALEGRDLLIRSGSGPKLQAAERGDQVAFEVDDLDEVTRAGWPRRGHPGRLERRGLRPGQRGPAGGTPGRHHAHGLGRWASRSSAADPAAPPHRSPARRLDGSSWT